MRSYPAHRQVEMIGNAAKVRGLPAAMISFSDHESRAFLCLPVLLRNLLNPFALAVTARSHPEARLLLIRDFLTVPLLLGVPFLWQRRGALMFVLNHNIQSAHNRLRDRLALRFLLRCGFRFLCLESEQGLIDLGLRYTRSQVLTLPLGVSPDLRLMPRSTKSAGPVIGLIGHMRPEKGYSRLADFLEEALRSGQLNGQVLVGSPDQDVLSDAHGRGFSTMDTTSRDSYRDALMESDVLLLSYNRKDYFYRPSATIVDAIAVGRPVACPDFPTLKAQITQPAVVGATFKTQRDIPCAIAKAMKIPTAAFRAQVEHRSLANIGRVLESFLSGVQISKSERLERKQ
jgi:hypothetical protein